MGIDPLLFNISATGVLPAAGQPAPSSSALAGSQPVLLAENAHGNGDDDTATIAGGGTAQPAAAFQSCQDFPSQTAGDFISSTQSRLIQYQAHISELNAEIDLATRTIDNQEADPDLRASELGRRNSLRGELAEFNVLVWLAARETGQPRPLSSLITALSHLPGNGSAYWRAQIAMILSSELEDASIRQALYGTGPGNRILRNDNGWRDATDPVERERLVLEQIYDQLLTHNGQPRNELSLMIGENLYRRALIAKNQGRTEDFHSLLIGTPDNPGAMTYINRLATTIDVASASRAQLLAGRENYIRDAVRTSQRNNYELLRREIAWANYLMASITMREAEGETDLSQNLASLEQAAGYLNNAAPLVGFSLLAARAALADNLIQQGFISRNLDQPHIAYFSEALCHLDAIRQWHDDYVSQIGASGTVQRWLVNINASVRVSRAKLIMAFVGEIGLNSPAEVLALLANDLTESERQLLGQEPSLQDVLRIQRRLLEAQAQELEAAAAATYSYGSTTIPVLQEQEIMGIRIALAENYARQAFIARSLNNQSSYNSLIGRARTLINEILVPDSGASPLTQAIAHLWLGKILLVEVGEAHTFEENSQLLDQAMDHIEAAIAAGQLQGQLLLSAQQSRNEIRLLRLELTMRQGESYPAATVSELETLAFELFGSEPIGSPLIERALRDLIESYSAREENHGRIILLVNVLLGRNGHGADPELADLRRAISSLRSRLLNNGQLRLPQQFQAWLYLKLAETTSWSNGAAGRSAAGSILSEVQQNFSALLDAETGEPGIRALYLLLQAEIEMRDEESAGPIFDQELAAVVEQSRDIDLIIRLTFAQIEGLAYEQEFDRIAALARAKLQPDQLQRIEQMFGMRRISFQTYRFRVWKALTDALKWSNEYAEAVEEMERLLAALPDLAAIDQAMADLLSTQIQIDLADIYRYDWPGRNYQLAIDNYQAVIDRYPDTASLSPDLILTIASARLGLAEILRNVPALRDLPAARQQYDAALALASRLNAETSSYHLLVAQIYLGLANLARSDSGWLQADLVEAAEHIGLAKEHIDQVSDAPEMIEAEIDRIYNDPVINSRIRPELNTDFQIFSGADGRSETQLTLSLHAPLDLGLSDTNISWLHLTLAEQMDLGPRGNIYSTYLGLHFMPHSNFTLDLSGRLATTGDAGATMQFFRHPDLRMSTFFWTEYFTAGGAVDLNFDAPDLNSYNASGMFNLAFTQIPFIEGLRLGAEFNSVPFTYGGEFRRMDSVAFGPRLDWNATPWLSIQANFMGLAYYSPDTDPTTEDEWHMGWQAGAGLGFNVLRWLRFDAMYNHQQTYDHPHSVGYPLDMFQGTLDLTF
ncbi:MAG: hypothetical protein JW782_00375 [Candidatus Saganbacteria bacterium]|nr:hypothetical protein [Candidatus Saganbacteria bacterium]